jgi:hypothetical protein
MNEEYIIPNIIGRLGNNLFMIAHAYAKSKELNKKLLIARNQVTYQGNDYSKNIFRKFDFIENFNERPPSIAYNGYFQSERYFKGYEKDIKELFGAPEEFIARIKQEIPEINKKTTVINVRRGGDYLRLPLWHPVITPEYIYKSLERIKDPGHFIIASDDIEWCKKNLNLSPCTYIENYKPEEQLWILSMCDNFVISNSSFSWWAAYLSNKEGTVVAPETWFGPSGPKNWKDMYCDNWVILPTIFKDGLILPK